MSPNFLVPSIHTDGMTWLEAKDAEQGMRAAAKAVRDGIRDRPEPNGRFNRRVHAWWLAGAGWAACLLEKHAFAYALHARNLEDAAK